MKKSTLKVLLCALSVLLFTQFAKAQCITVHDTLTPTICAGDTFYFNGVPQTRPGFRYLTDTVALGTGCDSITYFRLTVRRKAVDSFSQSICTGNSYPFFGQSLTASGVYRDTMFGGSVYGCDSFVIVNLTVGGSVTNNQTATICSSDSFLFNGVYLKAQGIYRDTVISGTACDSIVILRLTFKPSPTTTINQPFCTGSTYTFFGQVLSTPGVYRDTIHGGASNGCDSIVRLNYLPTYVRVTRRDTLCTTDTLFIPGGQYILGSSGSGRYAPDTVAFGCVDSVFTYTIHVDTPTTVPVISAAGLVLTETVTGFASYQWQMAGSNISGSTAASYTASGNGSYTVEGFDAHGCVTVSAPYTITGVGIIGLAGDQSLRLYPNPNVGSFVLETSDAIGADIVIYNALGQIAQRSRVSADRMNMSLQLAEGIYTLHVKNNKGAETTVQFTVVK